MSKNEPSEHPGEAAEGHERPAAERARLLRSVFEPSPLETVAEAVAVATREERRIYVERVAGGWRWSPTHPGGAYPLLRITARFLRVEHTSVRIGFRSPASDVFILSADPHDPEQPDAWAVIEFSAPARPDEVRERVLSELGPAGS